MTTAELLESLRVQVSAKATTNYEPMVRLRDVLEALDVAGETKPIDVEAAKAEARREAFEDAIRAARNMLRYDSPDRWTSWACDLIERIEKLRDLDNACKPAPLEKKAVDVEALALRLRTEYYGGDPPVSPGERGDWIRTAQAALDFTEKNGGAR